MNTTNGYLLDSHGLLWWWFEPQRLSHTVAGLLQDSRTAELEQLVLLTIDTQLAAFPCQTLW